VRRSVVLGGFGIALVVATAAGVVGTVRRAPAPPPEAANLKPAPPRPAPVAPSFDVVKVAPDGSVVIAGRAAPGARVTVRDGAAALGAVTADGRGEWVLLPKAPLSPGDRKLSLEARNPDAATATSGQSVALSVAPAAGAAAAALAPAAQGALAAQVPPGQDWVVQAGNSLWQIARHSYGSGLRYTVIYSANLQHIRNPDRIYPGQVFRVPGS
jgi:nucleoid-associated protein YgaU